MYYYRHMKNAGKPTLKPMVSSLGTARRMQALNYSGYGTRRLAALLGTREKDAHYWMIGHNKRVTARTDAKVRELFAKLWDKPGGDARAIAHAKACGYMPALAWDDMDNPDAKPILARGHSYEPVFDEVAVELAIHGRKPHLHPLETREVVRILHARTWSDERIAAWIGMSGRHVFRVRSSLGLPAWDPEHAATRRKLGLGY